MGTFRVETGFAGGSYHSYENLPRIAEAPFGVDRDSTCKVGYVTQVEMITPKNQNKITNEEKSSSFVDGFGVLHLVGDEELVGV